MTQFAAATPGFTGSRSKPAATANSGSPDAGVPEIGLTRPRVLVVEDEEKTRDSVTEGLRLEDWQVTAVAGGEQAIQMISAEPFDLVVLDWMLPDRDGIEVLEFMRSRGLHTPVLMLTARTTLDDRVVGLESGADDYLLKPFAFAELLARCHTLLRRPTMHTGRLLSYGDLQLDSRARNARRAGIMIPLTPREVEILEYLMRYQGQIVTREMLERHVWNQPGRATSLDNVIDVQMMRLRRKVDGDGPERLIHTIRGVGYRFGKVQE
jgi:two-component system copper resistance phosphate regulon response regulator CusR